MHLDLPGLDKDKVAAYIENNQTDDLYRYLLLTQCNALNEALPRMFEKMGGYTELLFPNNILKADSVLGRMVTDIPEEDWTDQVQIIGWLYQYYISEKHDQIINIYKGTVKKEDICRYSAFLPQTGLSAIWLITHWADFGLNVTLRANSVRSWFSLCCQNPVKSPILTTR